MYTVGGHAGVAFGAPKWYLPKARRRAEPELHGLPGCGNWEVWTINKAGERRPGAIQIDRRRPPPRANNDG